MATRDRSDFLLAEFIKEFTQIDSDIEKQRTINREIAVEATEKLLQSYNKQYYDQKHRQPTFYKQGDLILVKDDQLKPSTNQKLRSKYRSPDYESSKQELIFDSKYTWL